jgi:hypothetical protein
VAAWIQSRNEAQVTVHWRFTSRDARQKLARSYPKIKNQKWMKHYYIPL